MKNTHRNFIRRHHHLLIVSIVLMILLAGLVSFFVIQSTQDTEQRRLVTFYDQGKQYVVLTKAATVQGALDASRDLRLNPQDIVEPERNSKLNASQVDVIIYRSRLVAIVDGGVRQSVVTVAQSPNAILQSAKLKELGPKDDASFRRGDLARDSSSVVLTIKRVKEQAPPQPRKLEFVPRPGALTASKGAHIFVDSRGVAHRETYYDLPMNIVIGACGGTYTIRSDGAKVDQDGYVLVAANLRSYPRCSVVETSMGPGKVYDTGGFAVRHPYGFDLATDWTNYNGR